MGGYFSKQGMAFQTPGDDTEVRMNLQAAVKIVRDYITTGGAQSEVEEALRHILRERPKARPVIEKLKLHLFTDDLFGWEYHEQICKEFYNQLVRKI